MEPIRVLIVDDEDELVSALEQRLNLRGFQATGVTTGAEALSYLAETPCDVVLLDVKMPGLGGLELTRKIKEQRPELQVVLLTGWSSAEDARKGKELGAYDYLIKPVRIDDLVKVLLSSTAREE